MPFTTVYVDATDPRKPRELHRDARDPQGPDAPEIFRTADLYSRRGKTIRVHAIGQYIKPWRKQARLDIAYESHDGHATPDYQTVSR